MFSDNHEPKITRQELIETAQSLFNYVIPMILFVVVIFFYIGIKIQKTGSFDNEIDQTSEIILALLIAIMILIPFVFQLFLSLYSKKELTFISYVLYFFSAASIIITLVLMFRELYFGRSVFDFAINFIKNEIYWAIPISYLGSIYGLRFSSRKAI
jgi:hypothetical protein